MEPVTTVTTAWTIAKTAGEISKKLYEFGKSLRDREAKHQVDEILDTLRELKHQASQLEDENRELREKLRFKSDDHQFRIVLHSGTPRQTLSGRCAQNASRKGLPHQWENRVKTLPAIIVAVLFVAR